MRARVRARVRACVRACICVWIRSQPINSRPGDVSCKKNMQILIRNRVVNTFHMNPLCVSKSMLTDVRTSASLRSPSTDHDTGGE